MKNLTYIVLTSAIAAFILSSLFSGCTKEGPQGPAGQDGKDANNTCTQCHDMSDSLVTRIFQYDASRHALGSTTYTCTQVACAPCHSSQGFAEAILTNSDTTRFPVFNAAPVNCRTCHNIHSTYTTADYSLKVTSAFYPRFDKTKTLNLSFGGGSGNLCARCHQAVKPNPWITDPRGNDSLVISSTQWGPHHGAQALILAGMGAFEMGISSFGNTAHKDFTTCSSCHQGGAQGNLVGGHTLKMSSNITNDNVSVCKDCHASIGNNFDLDGIQTEITNKINALKEKLAAINMLDTIPPPNPNYMLIKPGKYSQSDLAVFWNFQLAYTDRSLGVHNYLYTRDMLQAGIDYMNHRGK